MSPRIEREPPDETTAGPPPHRTFTPFERRRLADQLGDEIAEANALTDSAMHRTLTGLRRFIEAGLWGEHDALSPVQWCSWRLGWPRSTAKTKVRVALALGRLPLIDDAFRRGLISYSIVRALVRVAAPENEARLVELARRATGNLCARIVGHAVRLMKITQNPDLDHLLELGFRNLDDGTVELKAVVLPEQAQTIDKAIDLKIRRDRAALKAQEERPAPSHAASPPSTDERAHAVESAGAGADASPSLADPDPTSESTYAGSADDEDRAVVSSLLREAEELGLALLHPAEVDVPTPADDPDPPPPEGDEFARDEWARRRVQENKRQATERRLARLQAFVGIFEEYILDERPARVVPGAVDALVIVDHATLASSSHFPIGRCELSDGTPISPETARRLTCDCPMSVALLAPDGTPLDVGRRTRQIPPPLWKALLVRDRHCTFPGCDRGGSLLNGHHIDHWARGGPTNLDNLTLTCRGHHRLVHEGGYSVVRLDAQTVVYLDPRGEPVMGSVAPEIVGDPLEQLRARARAQGLVIDGRLTCERVTGLREADMCATVGHVLEITPGSPWYRARAAVPA